MIFFADGSKPIKLSVPKSKNRVCPFTGSLLPDEASGAGEQMSSAASSDSFFVGATTYAVWSDDRVYHTQVRLAKGEALLIDTGAVGNLVGERTIDRMKQIAKDNGQGSNFTPSDKPGAVQGVGGSSSNIIGTCKVPIRLTAEPNGAASYEAPVIEGSDVPALLGAASLTAHRALVDTVHDQLILLGPGGMKLTLSPGSRVLPFARSPTGHLMLPASEWPDKNIKAQNMNQLPGVAPIALPVL
jgi:hypothetical protein